MSVSLASLTGIAFLSAASSAAASDTRGLIVAPDSVDLVQRSGKDTASVEYFVREPYPATGVLSFIHSSLLARGWRAVAVAELGAHERSSHQNGWDDVRDDAERLTVRLWSARWSDAQGNEVEYTPVYRYQPDQPELQPSYVGVAGRYSSKKAAARSRARMEEQLRRFTRRLQRRSFKPSADTIDERARERRCRPLCPLSCEARGGLF